MIVRVMQRVRQYFSGCSSYKLVVVIYRDDGGDSVVRMCDCDKSCDSGADCDVEG